MKGSAQRFAAAFGAVVVSTASFAAPPPPPAPTPGQVQAGLPTQPPQPKPGPLPSVNTAPVTPSGVAPGGATFTVQRFDIEGNSAISTDELQAQIAGYVGKSMTLAQLYDVADVLTRYYRSNGYGLAFVTPPAQKISNGSVRLQVVEGRLGKINVQGNSRTRTSVLLGRAADLRSGDVYTDAAAQRATLLMNDLPGVTAHGSVSPGAEYGTSDMLFDVNETAYSGDASIDDYGRAALGRWRLSADIYLDSLTGSGDQLSAGITHSDGNLLNFGKLGYLLPVGTSSTLDFSFNRAFYHVGGPVFGKLDIEGSTQNSGILWQWARIRTQEQSLYWGLGVTHDGSQSQQAGSAAIVSTNITLLQLTMLYTRQMQDQSYYSLDTQAWTNGKSNKDGTSNSAEKLRLEEDASWVKPLGPTWTFIGQGAAAYSLDPLVDNDKYSLGGPGSVRGFQSAEARGDSGLFGSAELQWNLNAGGRFPLAWGYFFDTGKVWNKSFGTSPANSTSLSSVGTEFQLLPTNEGWSSRLQFAWAVGGTRPSDDLSAADKAPHDRGPHIWFTLAKAF